MLCIGIICKRGTMKWEHAFARCHVAAVSMMRLCAESMDPGRRCESIPSGELNKEGLDPGQGYLRECWWFLEMEQLSGMDVGCVGVFYNGGSIGEQINDFKYSKVELG